MITATVLKEVCSAACRTCEKQSDRGTLAVVNEWIAAHLELLPDHIVEMDLRQGSFHYLTPRPEDRAEEN